MDQHRFDDLARRLGAGATRRAGLRAALGGLLGIGAAAGVLDSEAKDKDATDGRRPRGEKDADAARKRRRKRCSPACAGGQTCVRGACRCDNGGAVCSAACCLIGETCQGGTCVQLPNPDACIAPGEPCKSVGIPCCAGRVCASGQGGTDDIACYAPKTGACERTSDCVYGVLCQGGRCAPPAPAPLGASCNLAAQQLCATPGAVCTPYTAEDAPGGTHCSLPLRMVCTGDPDCTCYHCDFVDDVDVDVDVTETGGRTSSNTKACCLPAERACTAEQDCCAGLTCTRGVCAGPSCIAIGGTGCAADGDCCDGGYCDGGSCRAYPEVCDVCAGDCPYDSIAAAYAALNGSDPVYPADGTIWIAPGVYTEPMIRLSRNMTFRRCGSSGAVVWRGSTRNEYILREESGYPATSVTLKHLEFAIDPTIGLTFLTWFGGASAQQRLTLTATGCTWRDLSRVVYSSARSAAYLGNYVDATFTDCVFTGNQSDSSGPALYSEGHSASPNTVALTRCTFRGNTSGFRGGAVYAGYSTVVATDSSFTGNSSERQGGAFSLGGSDDFTASLTLTNCTLRENAADLGGSTTRGGGAIWVTTSSSLTLAGTTLITANTTGSTNPSPGSGIQVLASSGPTAPTRITGTTTANVFGNVNPPDCTIANSNTPTEIYAVSCSGWCVASGQPCNTLYTTCCSGACSTTGTPGTCP